MEIFELIRQGGGNLEARGDRLHVDAPAGVLLPDLKAYLKKHKAAILEHLELGASMQRLEAAHLSVAVFDDGSMRVIQSNEDAEQIRVDGGNIYTPPDMYHYIRLDERERRILHTFKRRFGGIIEWRMEVIKAE